ncbi:MAG: sulfatase-like hydrolase/transferase [Pirellulales bacterium]
MPTRAFHWLGLAIVALLTLVRPVDAGISGAQRPNVVLIVCDNLGYGDTEPYGSVLHRTPHLNRLAEQGMRFTQFYAASGVCTPSRAALMTGCYPRRVGMDVTDGAVLRPVSALGLNPDEVTIAERLRSAGYATAIFGKWHLGDQPDFCPRGKVSTRSWAFPTATT